MLNVHTKFSEVIQSVFNGDQQFVGALDKVNVGAFAFFAAKLPLKSICPGLDRKNESL